MGVCEAGITVEAEGYTSENKAVHAWEGADAPLVVELSPLRPMVVEVSYLTGVPASGAEVQFSRRKGNAIEPLGAVTVDAAGVVRMEQSASLSMDATIHYRPSPETLIRTHLPTNEPPPSGTPVDNVSGCGTHRVLE